MWHTTLFPGSSHSGPDSLGLEYSSGLDVHAEFPADSNIQTKNQPSVQGESLFHTHKMDDAVGFNNLTMLLIRVEHDTDNAVYYKT